VLENIECGTECPYCGQKVIYIDDHLVSGHGYVKNKDMIKRAIISFILDNGYMFKESNVDILKHIREEKI